jgi:hypothetical protein
LFSSQSSAAPTAFSSLRYCTFLNSVNQTCDGDAMEALTESGALDATSVTDQTSLQARKIAGERIQFV